MRRLVALFVVALIGAGLFGAYDASGLASNQVRVSDTVVRAELSAIATTPVLQCYVTALDPVNFAAGAGGSTIASAGSAAWSNLRLEGLTITNYVARTFHYHPSARALASATSALEDQMTQSAATNQLTCPGTPAQAFAAMPAEMRSFEALSEADSLELVSKLDTTVPLTPTSLRTYYDAHVSDYDTLCLSVALVSPTNVSAFAAAQAAGDSVATLAKKFSVDTSASKGGAYGCWPPANASYSSIRSEVNGLALDTFATTPNYVSLSGSTYALYVAVTKRSITPFASAESAVLKDLQNANASSANTVKENLLYAASVAVDPTFGRWGLASSGPQVFAPALPSAGDVSDVAVLTSPNATPYK